MGKLIIIEGNIGSGKTTLTGKLASALSVVPFYEPVETNPYIEDFYKDKKRWALEMQFWLMANRFKMHQKAIDLIWQRGETVVMDRSIYGDGVFASMMLDSGLIDEKSYKTYLNMKEVMHRFLMLPHLAIFIMIPPEKCMDRIKKRGRGFETEISENYLRKLHEKYNNLRDSLVNSGVEIFDATEYCEEDGQEIIEKIKPYTKKFSRYKL